MRCRQCDYPLWNLSEPRCPECGTGFDLRTYRFTPGSVAFGCPHCGALHGGTGPNYLPAESDTATCQSCGQVMSVPHMRVVPLSDTAEAEAANTIPWQQRESLGWFRAWYRTCFMAMTEPARLGRELGPTTPFSNAYWFAVITSLFASIVTALFFGTCFGAVAAIGSQSGISQQDIEGLMWQAIGQLIAIPLSFLTPLITVGITGGVAHLFLRMTGETRGGFHLTALSVLFGQGPLILGAIPICGGYVGAIWMLVSTILVLRSAQDVSGVRATFAILVLPILALLLVVVLIIGVAVAATVA